ncbi:TenA family protein [Pseudomonas sp. GX19020]|uniref:TenA family protein n=1 Tax=Pseudomonadota TaxID=1224 RepID=UPI00089BD5AD|nr:MULTISPECIES: TenA family protein [Pseudomonadota]MCL4064995.1 TenA family protein [Pseudomonas sp. GX19020]SEB62969.1 thiaminase (transcriptional activator TenA) [Rhodobacter sp. 24-YEA-8]
MSAADYGAGFAALRSACPDDWNAYTRHAFLDALHDGSLPRADFLSYLRQDYVFLIHFARAWSLAVVKAGNLAEMQAASATVHGLLHHEMALHIRLCAAAGISAADLAATEEATGNLAYTRYVLDAGLSGDFLDLLAALLPCVLGYGEIGARLIATAGETPYRDWIETYGGETYQQICREAGALFDMAIRDRLGEAAQTLPRWRQLERHFRVATRLEAGFWRAGLA